MFQIAEQNGGHLSATLYYKYGFDGSGSHHRAMQPDAAGDQPECKTLNATQMVPLRLLKIGAQKRSFYLIMRGQTTLILPGQSGWPLKLKTQLQFKQRIRD